jgi:hypothetical protein
MSDDVRVYRFIGEEIPQRKPAGCASGNGAKPATRAAQPVWQQDAAKERHHCPEELAIEVPIHADVFRVVRAHVAAHPLG